MIFDKLHAGWIPCDGLTSNIEGEVSDRRDVVPENVAPVQVLGWLAEDIFGD